MLVLDWLVGEKHDARRERLALDQVKRLLLALLWEEALPAAQDHRKDHQAIFVDEASRVKRVDQLTTAEHQDILTVLLPQSGQCFRQIALEQGGIPGHGRGVFRNALVDALTRELGTRLDITVPEAGMHLVVWLPSGMSAQAAAQRAARYGLHMLPISQFSLRSLQRDGLVLGFASASQQELRAGVHTLALALQAH